MPKKPSKPRSTSKTKVSGAETASSLPPTSWARQEFLEHCGLSEDVLAKGGLSWEELAAIYDDHVQNREGLATRGEYIANVLRRLPGVHTVRIRVKSPEHLIGKVLRKRIDDSREITFANYRTEITDLIGLRALHLFKDEWNAIHQFISAEWELAEEPKAYIRDGDWGSWIEEFSANGCKVETHPRSYRSVHYLVKSAPSKVPVVAEIQVRTIFEEGWSEIDHRINYPVAAPVAVGFYLGVFNRLAGMADEMGSLLHVLMTEFKARDDAAQQVRAERDQALERVEQLVEQLEIGSTKRKELHDQLQKLRSSASTMISASTLVSASSASAALVTGSPIQSALSTVTSAALGGVGYSHLGSPYEPLIRIQDAATASIHGTSVSQVGIASARVGACTRCNLWTTLLNSGLCSSCRLSTGPLPVVAK